MTAIRMAAHHFRRGNLFYFRQVVPADIRQHFPANEICFSLRTEISKEAARLAAQLAVETADLFRFARGGMSISDEDFKKERFKWMIEAKLVQVKALARHEEKENALIDTLAERQREMRALREGHAAEVAELATRHAAESARQQDGHEQTIAAMTAGHAEAVAEIVARQPTAPVPQTPPATPPSPLPMLLSEAVERLAAEKLSKNKWKKKTEDEYRAIYAVLIRILGDMPMADIDQDEVIRYTNTMKLLPANMNKLPQFIGKSIDEILAMNPEPMGIRTVNKNIERISSLFKATMRNRKSGVTHNPFAGQTVEAKKTSDEKERKPFTDDELAALLSHETFTAHKFNNPYTYWSIPLALFTGARQNEIAQLHLSDFVEVDGMHCIDINDDEDEKTGDDTKRLKNFNSRRLVPIHDELIRLGILDYVAALRSAGYARLFPEIGATRDGYGATISKWFARHRGACGIVDKQVKVFHSFRHTMITRLFNVEAPMYQVVALVGHEMGLVTYDVYFGKDDSPAARKRTVDRLVYPAEVVAMIPTVHEVRLDVYGHGQFWKSGKIVKKMTEK